jgi:hypothetical protein
MRSLRERGQLERDALARRLRTGPGAELARVPALRRVGYATGRGSEAGPTPRKAASGS